MLTSIHTHTHTHTHTQTYTFIQKMGGKTSQDKRNKWTQSKRRDQRNKFRPSIPHP